MIPPGATHVHTFYGRQHYYQRQTRQHLNQVSEEWQTLVRWLYWTGRNWQQAGAGFCDRHLAPL